MADVIDRLAGVESGSPLHALRDRRPDARLNAQRSYEALFEPASLEGVSLEERRAVAAFVAGLHRDADALAFYKRCLVAQGLAEAIDEEIARGTAIGPYGHYPQGPLSVEDKAGPVYRVPGSNRKRLGSRLAAALEHAHLLLFHPRDASPAALEALRNAGWSMSDIVTLSQLAAFLTFQIRVVQGLRALVASNADGSAAK